MRQFVVFFLKNSNHASGRNLVERNKIKYQKEKHKKNINISKIKTFVSCFSFFENRSMNP